MSTHLDASPAVAFGMDQLRAAMADTGRAIDLTLLAGDDPAQGYTLRREGSGWQLLAGDESGAMYGLLDVAERLRAGQLPAACEMRPLIAQRGLKINVPLDARTPSYTDCGDSAQQNIETMWDMAFWQGLLDRMALSRYNALTLWNLGPFPSLVRVPEYPSAALDDVMRGAYPAAGTSRAIGFYTAQVKESLIRIKRMTMDEKIAFWRGVMDYAATRCVRVYLFTWNIYLYGLEDSGYDLTESPQDMQTADYYRRSVEVLVRTYPRLAGIGVTAGENMQAQWNEEQDVRWVRDTYGRGIEAALADTPGRDFSLIHRSHMTTVPQMVEAFAGFGADFALSYKYAMAHMATTPAPRFGDAFFASLPPGQKTWLTLRNDDFYLYPWADTDFLHAFVQGMPHDKMAGFYYGADGIIWGREWQSREASLQGRYLVDKHWLAFSLLGRLGYHGECPREATLARIAAHYPGLDADVLLRAWENASRPVGLLQRVYWRPYDFQWYPEACCSLDEPEHQLVFHDLNHFAQGVSCPGLGYLSPKETAQRLLLGEESCAHDSLGVACQMQAHAVMALETLDCLGEAQTPEARELLGDIRRMCRLGQYYAHKLRAAVYLLLYRQGGAPEYLDRARTAIGEAVPHYLAYSAQTAAMYRPQLLSRLRGVVSPEQFDVRAQLDIRICEDDTR